MTIQDLTRVKKLCFQYKLLIGRAKLQNKINKIVVMLLRTFFNDKQPNKFLNLILTFNTKSIDHNSNQLDKARVVSMECIRLIKKYRRA